MPQAVAVPLASAGIGALGGILGGKKKTTSPAQTPFTPDQQQAQSGITNLARMLQDQSAGVYQVGLPAYQRATGFYNSLLGSKAGQTQALAPALENTAASYAGAQNALSARTQRGPTQDLARAELTRDAAGAARDLYRDAPYKAADQLGQLGVAGLGQAGGTAGQAMAGYSGLLNNSLDAQRLAMQQQQINTQNTHGLFSGLGNLLTQLLPALTKSKSPAGGSGYAAFVNPPGSQTTNATGYGGIN